MKDTMPPIRTFVGSDHQMVRSHHNVAVSPAVPVSTFTEAVELVAKLTFQNPHLNLLFRGQARNYANDGSHGPNAKTSLLPSVYRKPQNSGEHEELALKKKYFRKILPARTQKLKRWMRKLGTRHKRAGFGRGPYKDTELFSEPLWALLQHYGCATPLLDVSASLRVACSFATYDYERRTANREGFVYVLGLPSVTSHVAYLPYDGIVIVKLQSACPPEAKRPHYQQGFLVGSLPHDPKMHWYGARDLALRLVAKLRITDSASFWAVPSLCQIEPDVMMPTQDEVAAKVQQICEMVPFDGI